MEGAENQRLLVTKSMILKNEPASSSRALELQRFFNGKGNERADDRELEENYCFFELHLTEGESANLIYREEDIEGILRLIHRESARLLVTLSIVRRSNLPDKAEKREILGLSMEEMKERADYDLVEESPNQPPPDRFFNYTGARLPVLEGEMAIIDIGITWFKQKVLFKPKTLGATVMDSSYLVKEDVAVVGSNGGRIMFHEFCLKGLGFNFKKIGTTSQGKKLLSAKRMNEGAIEILKAFVYKENLSRDLSEVNPLTLAQVFATALRFDVEELYLTIQEALLQIAEEEEYKLTPKVILTLYGSIVTYNRVHGKEDFSNLHQICFNRLKKEATIKKSTAWNKRLTPDERSLIEDELNLPTLNIQE